MERERHEDIPDKSAAIIVIAAFLASLFTVIGGPTSPATANTASNLPGYLYYDDGTYIFTYDFLSVDDWGRNNVDWATSLFFYDGASISTVKNLLNDYGYDEISTNSMHMPVKEGSELAVWDDDAGRKDIMCPLTGEETRHYRIYSDPATDFMWTPEWGAFVVATTHWDANECPPINTRFYDSEEVEGNIGNIAASLGLRVDHDYAYFHNTEPYRVEGASTWDNDGYATYIHVPGPILR